MDFKEEKKRIKAIWVDDVESILLKTNTSKSELARMVGVSRQRISQMLSNEFLPEKTTIDTIEKALKKLKKKL